MKALILGRFGLAKTRELDKSCRASETCDSKTIRLAKRNELDKIRRGSQSSDAKELQLAKRREAYESKVSVQNSHKGAHSTCDNSTKAIYLNEFDVLIISVGQKATLCNFINLCSLKVLSA